MPFNFKKFFEGIKIVPKAVSTANAKGEIEVDSVTGKANYHNGTTLSPVVTEAHTATLTNKTIDDDNNTIQNIALTGLKTVLADASKFLVRDASGIVVSNTKAVPTGDVVGTSDSQVLTNKTIDADASTITNIDDGNIKALAAIDATKLADGSVSNTEYQQLNGVTSAIQTQLDAKLDDFASVNDNRIVRTDGTAGDAIQESAVTLDNSGNMSGVGTLGLTGPVTDQSLTADRALVSNGSKALVSSATTATEIGHVSGVTSAIQTQLDGKVNDTGDTMSGILSMGNNKITNLGSPVDATDAATKGYVDGVAQGLDIKASVRVATTAAGTLASDYENGDTVDGVVLATGNRILIKNLVASEFNGIYIVAASGAPTRALDADAFEELVGAFTFVEEGTMNGDTGWVCSANSGGVLGVTALPFVQFSTAGATTTDGQGIEITGNELSLELDGTTLSKSGSGLKVNEIADAQIAAAAAIARSKLASGTNYRILANNATGVMSENAALTASRAIASDANGQLVAATTTTTELNYSSGVTSAIQTQLDAKQARATLTAKGSLYVATASGVVAEQAIGTDTHVLTADSGQTNGLKWAIVASAPTTSNQISNVGLATSVAANALTIDLKDAAGSNPSVGSPCLVGFRNTTLTTGQYVQRSVAGALTLVIPSGATMGHASARASYLHVYLIDNAGTPELAVSTVDFEDGSIVSTTTIGTGSDSNAVMYSTTGRSNVACRLIALLEITEATAGTWASNATKLSLVPFKAPVIRGRYTTTAGQTINASGVEEVVNFDTIDYDPFNVVTVGAGWVLTAPRAGVLKILEAKVGFATTFSAGNNISLRTRKNGAAHSRAVFEVETTATLTNSISIADQIVLAAGETFDITIDQDNASTKDLTTSAGVCTIVFEFV